MTLPIKSILEVASGYDSIVFDQWGVLHNGSEPYPKAISTLKSLSDFGVHIAVLSNSGKRTSENEYRIKSMGFDHKLIDLVMTSGEALWLDIKSRLIPERRFFFIEHTPKDAKLWSSGLDIKLCKDLDAADAIIIMGIPDFTTIEKWHDIFIKALKLDLKVYCSNPDLASPRSDNRITIAPGALAYFYKELGGNVVFYGKPHRPVFKAVEQSIDGSKLMMVGDSLEHDIAGAHDAGWDSVFVQGGLLKKHFAQGDSMENLDKLCKEHGVIPPTYQMEQLA